MSDPVLTDDFTVSGDDPTPEPVVSAAVAEPEAPVAEPVDDLEPDTEPDPASAAGKELAKKRGSLQKRIDAAVAKQREAERRAEEAERRLRERETPSSRTEPEKPKEPEYLTRPKPREDEVGTKYATYGDYIEDLTDWKTDEKDARRQQASAAEQAHRAERDRLASYSTRLEVFRSRTPDFDAVVTDAVQVSPPMRDAIVASEHGPAIAYYLGQHPEDAVRIAKLPAGLQFMEIGKIEMRVSAAPSGPAPTAPVKTNAKPPIKPVGSSPVTSDDEGDPDDLSEAAVNAHIRRENQKDIASRRR